MGFPIWMYHQTQDSKIFDSEEVEDLKKEGWREHWKEFENNSSHDKAQKKIGEAEEANSEILSILKKMTRDELCEYARESFNVKLDKRKSQKKLMSEVKDLVDGNCT